MENDLRIIEIRNVLLGTVKYRLEQRPQATASWVAIGHFDSLEKARAAEQFIRENGTPQAVRVIAT